MLHRFANPTRFLRLANAILPWVTGLTIILIGAGLYFAFGASPPDYQPGETVRIMYVPVPSPGMALFAHAVTATFSFVVLLVAIVDQGIESFYGFDIDMPAAATLAAIWPAKFNIGFAAERGAPISTMPGFDINLGLIEEFHSAHISDHSDKSERALHANLPRLHADLKRAVWTLGQETRQDTKYAEVRR
mgnify:CR=1 FL=1